MFGVVFPPQFHLGIVAGAGKVIPGRTGSDPSRNPIWDQMKASGSRSRASKSHPVCSHRIPANTAGKGPWINPNPKFHWVCPASPIPIPAGGARGSRSSPAQGTELFPMDTEGALGVQGGSSFATPGISPLDLPGIIPDQTVRIHCGFDPFWDFFQGPGAKNFLFTAALGLLGVTLPGGGVLSQRFPVFQV